MTSSVLPLWSAIAGSPHQATLLGAVLGQPCVPGRWRLVCGPSTQAPVAASYVRRRTKTFCPPLLTLPANVTPALTVIEHPPLLKYCVPFVQVPDAYTPVALSWGAVPFATV